MRLAVSVMLAFPLLLAGQPVQPPPPAPSEATQPAPLPAPKITLIEAGADPKSPLRLAPAQGARQSITLRMEMSSTMRAGERELPRSVLPAMAITLNFAVQSVSPEGDITYATRIMAAEAQPVKDCPPELVETIGKSLTPLTRLSGTCTVSSRGQTREARFDTPPEDPLLGAAIGGMKDHLAQFSVPFPEEPIGTGARWKVDSTIFSQGMRIGQTVTYTLRELRDNTAFLDVEIVQHADPQEITMVNLPPGQRASLVSLKSSGGGTMEVPLASVVPRKSQLRVATDLKMTVGDGVSATAIDQSTNLLTTIEEKPIASPSVPTPAPADK